MEPVKIWWTTPRYQKLFAWYLSPQEKPKALICLVHGHGEHSWRYLPWAERFAKNGYAVLSWDHIGHGMSDGQRGHVWLYEQLLLEIDLALTKGAEYFPNVPIFLYGHSMGGNIVLNHALRRCCRVEGIIATSPWLKLAKPVPFVLETIVSILNIILPIVPIKSSVKATEISHIEEEVRKYATDPLNHGWITPRLYFSIKNAGEYFINNVSKLKIPTLMLHGEDDLITSFGTTKEAAKYLPAGEFHSWPGMYHELHHESVREEVFEVILNWLTAKNKSN